MSMTSNTDRIHVRYYSSRLDEYESNSHMFIEDFGNNVVPSYGLKSEGINCILEPDNNDILTMLYELLPSHRQHYRPSLTDAVLNSIEYIAQLIVDQGIIVFKLIKYKDGNEKEIYKLEPIHGNHIKISKDKVIQILPVNATNENGIEIPLFKCFVFEFPKSLGGKEKYLKFLKEFREISTQSPTINFVNNPLQEQLEYNFSEHLKLFEIELRKASKAFNWPHREAGGENFSGYYNIYRHLLFRKNKIKLRDYIIDELCKIISNLSESIHGQKVELKIEGLLTIDEIETVIENWETGQSDINTIRNVL
jgi:hypothetical protein